MQRNLTIMKKVVSSELEAFKRKYKTGELIFSAADTNTEYPTITFYKIIGYGIYNTLDHTRDTEPNLTVIVEDLRESSAYTPNFKHMIDPLKLRKCKKYTKKNIAEYLVHPNQNIRRVVEDVLAKYKVR